MSTRRRDQASEKEQAQSDGGRTGADPEADPPTPPGGSFQWGPVRELTPSVYRGAYYCPPPAFRPEMDSVEWLERLEDFFCVSRVPPSDQGVVARYLLSDSVRRELYPAGQTRENSFEEFKTRLLGTYGPEESTGQLIERFHALHQREGQTIEQYAQEVAEVGRRAGVSERDLVARFTGGITSKQAYLAMRLQEPPTLAEARKLVSKVVRAEEDFHQSQQSHTSNPKPEKTEVAQSIDALIREVGKLSLKLERQEPTTVRPAGRRDGCFNCGGLGHLRRDCPHTRRRTQRQPTGTQSGGPGNRRVLAMTGLQAGDAPCVNGKLNGTRVSLLLNTGAVVSVIPESPWHSASGGEPSMSENETILLVDGRRMCISGVGVMPLQLGRWRGRVPREASFWSESGDRRGDEWNCFQRMSMRPSERERTSTERRRTNWRRPGGRSAGSTRRVVTLRTTSQSLKIFKI
ncbi:hypothetical protein T11_13191 [Trichinella zimbabwensis]|uniref:CCHC-type domain-containing protein n=1 Tax=Trichinella zimbabwensis TaxID=268475 RepID=A0A0V1I3S4_9BILA|nr:hypothetical protein T11_13191 [Trichinella zimbabwensis]